MYIEIFDKLTTDGEDHVNFFVNYSCKHNKYIATDAIYSDILRY